MEKPPQYAEVAVAAGRHGRETYTYAIPAGMPVAVGQQVWVPFGPRDEHGYVVALTDIAPQVAAKAIKNIDKAPPLLPYQIALAGRMRERYWATLGECLQAMVPPRIRAGGVPSGERQRKFSGILKQLDPGVAQWPEYKLSAAQEAALAAWRANAAILLLGVTGSGKTEVYLRAAEETVAAGKQVLVLSPEAAPTPQLVERFAARFPGQVAILSSGLTDLERAQEWSKVRAGRAKVVIGNRSAVFAPLPDPGLICIDEEGSSSYQEERRPRYNATGVAWDLASLTGAKLILGSATPSLAAYSAALAGRLTLVRMPERITGEGASVRLVDMRSEANAGNRTAFARGLETELGRALDAGKQAILLQNRRHPRPYALCRACGKAVMCPNCSVAMGQDQDGEGLSCAICGTKMEMPLLCPSCHKPEVGWGGRVQKLEGWLARKWPRARVVFHSGEADLDAHLAAYSALKSGQTDIVVGTQSMGHGFDLPNVAVVGILDADSALHGARYDAAEAAFGYVLQAAGRAGRGQGRAVVLVQTMRPEHYSLRYAAAGDYEGFAAEELGLREVLGYPPAAELATLTFSHKDPAKAKSEALKAAARLKVAMAKAGLEAIELLGPAPAEVAKLRGEWRWQLSLKGQGLARLREALPSEHGWQTELAGPLA